MPWKVEIYSQIPRIEIHHDLISSGLADMLSDLSHDNLVSKAMNKQQILIARWYYIQHSPLTLSASSGKIKSSSGRVGKTGFIRSHPGGFDSKLSAVVTHLRHLAGRAVGLDGVNAESLQVVSYGIGGHYEPHVDYFNSVHRSEEPGQDRMATLLFYLSDVQAGGATVFPFLDVAVSPSKGKESGGVSGHEGLNGADNHGRFCSFLDKSE